MKTAEELKKEMKGMTPEEAVAHLSVYLKENPRDDGALTLRGIKYWSLGRRADAINDYLAALEINPESKAKQAMQATYDILDYYNKDLYNP